MSMIVIIFIAFIVWLILDFKIGRKKHLQQLQKRSYPTRKGKWLFFGNGHDLYQSLFQDISDARDHIHILFYIIRDDQISQEFLELLMKKAKEGVTVRLLLDRIGAYRLPKKKIKKLKKCGVSFSYSNHPRFPNFFYSLNYRNHRKISVIDGTIGYFGGFNIGKEYLGQDPKLGFWRDFHLKIYGDGVQDLQKEFLHDWKRATGEDILMMKHYFPLLPKGTSELQFVPTDGAFVKEFLGELIDNTKEEIIIGTPYFIPGKDIAEKIIAATNRGVEVSIIVPMKADHPLVREAAFPYFKQLLKAGCNIYRYTNGFFHGKVILIDNKLCDFGTANFDKRSFFINDELNCLFSDQEFIARVRSEMISDLHQSELLTLEDYHKRPYIQRGKEIVSTIFSALL